MKIGTRAVVGAVASLLIASRLSAQSPYVSDCKSPSGGMVTGSVLDDSTGRPVTGVGVFLEDIGCASFAGSGGGFRFDNVPVGTHSIQVRTLWYRKVPPMSVRVIADSIAQVEIRLQEGNAVLDCMDVPVCATVLKPEPTSLRGLTEEQKMREVALRTAFAVHQGASSYGAVPCMGDTTAIILRVLAARIPGSVPASDCVMSEGPPSLKSFLIEKRSGKKASNYSTGRPRIVDDDTFEVGVSYYAAPLAGAGWACRFKKEKGAWVPKSCRMTVIS